MAAEWIRKRSWREEERNEKGNERRQGWNHRKEGRKVLLCLPVLKDRHIHQNISSLHQHKRQHFVLQLTSIRTKQNHVLINPRASFMSAPIYLSQRGSLVITLAELVPLKILGRSTVIYRIEKCLERIQHYSSLLKTLTFQMKTKRKAKYW